MSFMETSPAEEASTFDANTIRRVAIVFSGGPAPGANAVISAAAMAFRRSGREVVGFLNGYTSLVEYDRASRPLVAGSDFFVFQDQDLRGLRNSRGILVGTGRANPGKAVRRPDDLKDSEKTALLRRVHAAL